ncbi:MAG: TGS domain-containing protein, partial [Deltaproteobacteria bacterium]|nr:TGS domain-containing protein [Deltaproteobacteria bacterium]
QKKGTSKRETAYSIEREGAAQIAVIGPPNVGKSSLIATLTNATPEVADFPHSTWSPSPGMVLFENIQFQLIDTPPITMGYIDPLMVDLIRRADILIILLDLHADPLQQLESTLCILQGLRIFPDGVSIPEGLKKLPFIKKVFVVLNKMDETEDEEDYEIFLELSETKLPTLGISVLSERNLTILIEKIYDMSDIIRVYTKSPGKEEDFNVPFVLPKESTLEELAVKIHKDFTNKLKFAKIWGKAVFDGQMVQRDYILQDGDVVEIHI